MIRVNKKPELVNQSAETQVNSFGSESFNFYNKEKMVRKNR